MSQAADMYMVYDIAFAVSSKSVTSKSQWE